MLEVTTKWPEAFANAAVSLYLDKDQFLKAQQNGYQIVTRNFDTVGWSKELKITISKILKDLKKHREFNFIGSLLRHQSLQSTKYMAKWIEEKAKIK